MVAINQELIDSLKEVSRAANEAKAALRGVQTGRVGGASLSGAGAGASLSGAGGSSSVSAPVIGGSVKGRTRKSMDTVGTVSQGPAPSIRSRNLRAQSGSSVQLNREMAPAFGKFAETSASFSSISRGLQSGKPLEAAISALPLLRTNKAFWSKMGGGFGMAAVGAIGVVRGLKAGERAKEGDAFGAMSEVGQAIAAGAEFGLMAEMMRMKTGSLGTAAGMAAVGSMGGTVSRGGSNVFRPVIKSRINMMQKFNRKLAQEMTDEMFDNFPEDLSTLSRYDQGGYWGWKPKQFRKAYRMMVREHMGHLTTPGSISIGQTHPWFRSARMQNLRFGKFARGNLGAPVGMIASARQAINSSGMIGKLGITAGSIAAIATAASIIDAAPEIRDSKAQIEKKMIALQSQMVKGAATKKGLELYSAAVVGRTLGEQSKSWYGKLANAFMGGIELAMDEGFSQGIGTKMKALQMQESVASEFKSTMTAYLEAVKLGNLEKAMKLRDNFFGTIKKLTGDSFVALDASSNFRELNPIPRLLFRMFDESMQMDKKWSRANKDAPPPLYIERPWE